MMHVVNDYQHSETTTILSLEKNKFGFRTKEVKEKIILIIGPNAYLGFVIYDQSNQKLLFVFTSHPFSY